MAKEKIKGERTLKCFENKAWRMNHLYHIVDKQSKIRLYKRNPIQEIIANEPANRKMVLKARQFGVSTEGILNIFDAVCFNKNVNACILSHEKDSIEKLFRIVRRAYNTMDPRVQPDLNKGGGSKYELFFPLLNSRIYCDLESRSDTIHYLHVSEAAFFKEPDRLLSTIQAVPLGGKITIETTPNGMGNHYYDWWMDRDGPYKRLFFPWFLHAEYEIDAPILIPTEEEQEFMAKVLKYFGITIRNSQLAFRRFKKAELKNKFAQEYPEDDASCFLSSGTSPLNMMLIKQLYDDAQEPLDARGFLNIYERSDSHIPYAIGADTAEGVGGDYSAACVIDCRNMRQVATLRIQSKPSDFAHELAALGREYNNAMIAVERNNHGHAVLLELDEHINYPYLYKAKDERVGWVTDRVTRPIMIDTFIAALENRSVTIQDKATLKECLTLVTTESGKIEAATGHHDDLVVAASIGIMVAMNERSCADMYSNIDKAIRI